MDNTEEFKLNFVVDYIIYRNEETKFTIFTIKRVKFEDKSLDKNPLSYVVKGTYFKINPGDSFSATCHWVYDKTHGYQLESTMANITYPQTENGILRFLQKSVRGLGTKMSHKIVDKFGVKSLDVIRNDYESLSKIPGIGKVKAKKIHDAVCKHEGIERLSVYLFGKGVTNYGEIVKIYEDLGDDALDKIIASPYSLCDYTSITKLPIADKIALSSGVDKMAQFRLERLIVFYLWDNSYNGGHCYASVSEIAKNLPSFLEKRRIEPVTLSEDELNDVVFASSKNKKLQLTKYGADTLVYLPHLYLVESHTAEMVSQLASVPAKEHDKSFYESFFEKYTKQTGIIPEENQKKAVINALENRFSIITGGAGTGKTQTVNTIIAAIRYENKNAKILLCSPTGRAAKRMSELTGKEASTIHRALGINGEGDLISDEPVEIEADYIICDEASMIDIILFRKLLISVVSSGASFILVGDKDQLPPVGAGLPFKGLVESGCVATTRLKYLFRQAENSQINQNANLILEGANGTTSALSFDVSKQDFFFFPADSPSKCHDYITRSIDSLMALGTKADDIVILSPMRKTEYGVISINNLVQNHLNPASPTKEEYKSFMYTFREGDRVMQTTNNYDLDVFNGDVGVITKIDKEEEEITVCFDDYNLVDGKSELVKKEVIYTFDLASELILAYAVTVHKSQGSEYPCVLMPVSRELINLSRNILYTAVTRSKKRFVFIGDTQALYDGIGKTENMHRHSLLKERVIKNVKGGLV